MLKTHSNNPNPETILKKANGDNSQSIDKAFLDFTYQQEIKQDVRISIEQLDTGQDISIEILAILIKVNYL